MNAAPAARDTVHRFWRKPVTRVMPLVRGCRVVPGLPVSRATAPHYSWGAGCDGWHLANAEGLNVIQERMPPGTSESRHFHERARQFFYVLEGTASFELDGTVHSLGPGQGIEVAPRAPHTMMNGSGADLAFLVVSVPPSHGDRIPA
jgi:mannose-6-phosphate isomerase-like protein (cupin superfamily)